MTILEPPKNFFLGLGPDIHIDPDPNYYQFVRIQENGKPLYKTPSGRLLEPAGFWSEDGEIFTR